MRWPQVKTTPHVRPLLEDTIITVPNIESFVFKQYNDTFIIENCTKYVAHILDNNPNFIIEKEPILNDCNILNKLDQEHIIQIIDKFEQDQLLTEVNSQLKFGQYEKIGSGNHEDWGGP